MNEDFNKAYVAKVLELGGKAHFLHDMIVDDLPAEKAKELGEWVQAWLVARLPKTEFKAEVVTAKEWSRR